MEENVKQGKKTRKRKYVKKTWEGRKGRKKDGKAWR